jgi:hypothetical protein
MIPTRFPVEFGTVFPEGVFILGVEPSQEFQDAPAGAKAIRPASTDVSKAA